MFEYLKDWLAEAVAWLLSGLKELLLTLLAVLREMGELVLQQVLSAAQAFFPDVSGEIGDQSTLLGQINHFFPLTETVGYLVALFGLWLLVLAYRLVKSWIPTVSGT